jgi:oxygen-dependent protoporphyrinogen oxidase
LTPRKEKRTILASTWTSTKWDHRADGEHVLIRLFLGEPGSEELLGDDGEIVQRAVAEVSEVLDIRAPPVFERLHRWPRGYPQYEVGHRERVAAIEAGLPPGLAVAGSPYHGVGLPDCIRSARTTAEGVLARLSLKPAPPASVNGGQVDGAAVPC